MVDLSPQFEISDIEGTTAHFNGSATVFPVQIPSVPATPISEVIIKNTNVIGLLKLQVSFDGGDNYFDIDTGDAIVWGLKGEVKSIYVKASSGSVSYQIIMNRELA